MVMSRRGFVDSYRTARLAHIAGTAYPAALLNAFVGLFVAFPKSDGTGGTEVTIAARPAITFSAPANNAARQQFTQSNNGVVSFTPGAGAGSGMAIGFGIFAAASGGTAVYIDYLLPPRPFAAGVALSFPTGSLIVWEEGGL